MHILLVDDEEFILESLAEEIPWQENGFDLTCARSAAEALEVLEDLSVHVMIVDIQMPDQNGIELVQQVRRAQLPVEVIILSCYNEFELVREAMMLGTCDYLFKPAMMPADILKSVRNAADKWQEKNQEASQKNGAAEGVRRHKRQQELILELIHGKKARENEIQECCLQERRVLLLLFKMMKYQEGAAGIFDNDLYLMRASVNNVIQETFEPYPEHILVNNGYYETVLVFFQKDSGEGGSAYERLDENIRKVQENLYAYYKIQFAIGVSEWKAASSYIHEAYQEAASQTYGWVEDEKPLFGGRVYSGGRSGDKDLGRGLTYIREHLGDKELSLGKVSDEIGLSRTYFSRYFKETMGINFIDYVTRMRVERAKELYQNTDLKVYEIAEMVGYSDWHYFYNVYKKIMGHSLSKEKRKN